MGENFPLPKGAEKEGYRRWAPLPIESALWGLGCSTCYTLLDIIDRGALPRAPTLNQE